MEEPPEVESGTGSETSDSSVNLTGSPRSSRGSSLDLTDASSSTSSQYSDWEAGAALAPPARARRRPLPAPRYTPPATPAKRTVAADRPAPSSSGPAPAPAPAAAPAPELPESYRPGEWLTAVSPRKAPYHPQMGDHCLYFRLGHQRYFEAVAEKDLYKLNPRDKPWERTHVYECELVKVVGVKYVIKPPRVVCLRLACSLESPRARSFTVRYHDMPDVIDFLVLRQQYEVATARHWGQGDRFRCMIDDSWWTGIVLERTGPSPSGSAPAPAQGCAEAQRWASAAAAHFLSLRVRWDNGEVERLSPWDLEPLDPERLPAEPGGAVPVLPHELEAVLYRAEADEWPPRGDRASACRAIALHISQVMSLSVAEPFVAPVDLQLYPTYAKIVPYPIDLATIKARFENLFYRRTASAQFDVRYLASNAEQFNEPHSPIVRQARLVTDLLLYIISHWREVDVLAKYHELAASYHSSDDEPLAPSRGTKSRRGRVSKDSSSEWREACAAILREVMSSADAEPFRQPVSSDQAPDYHAVISSPMDLGTVHRRLADNEYNRREQFCSDVRLVFANSRLYNTNKRSRIYSMTVRLSALFEALWSRMPPIRPRRAKRHSRGTRRTKASTGGGAPAPPAPSSSESDSEPLAATSRRVHAARGRQDSWDSDVPLHKHRKGKGVGKKSKSSSASAEPAPSTSRAQPREDDVYEPEHNGIHSGSEHTPNSDSESSTYTNIEVLEEELPDDEVELTYDEASDGRRQQDDQSTSTRSRKRERIASSASSGYSRAHRKHKRGKRNKPAKRIRERFAEGTPTSSSDSSGSRDADGGRRYESDRSYHPRYSTDDDAPLHLYRQRAEGNEEAGPSNARRKRNGHGRARRGVSLRARSPRRYNEDSEEDSVAAISKRTQHHHHLARRRVLAAQSVRAEVRTAHTSDHNYFNGHGGHASHASHTSHASHASHSAMNGNASQSAGTGSSAVPVSISSRGRVRKLTAKARGLLND